MKITAQHYKRILEALRPLAGQISTRREAVRQIGQFKDLEKRVRWDLAHAAGLTPFFCRDIYEYANDANIDTALKAAITALTDPTNVQ